MVDGQRQRLEVQPRLRTPPPTEVLLRQVTAEADVTDELAGMADIDRLRPRPPRAAAAETVQAAAADAELGDAVHLVAAPNVGCCPAVGEHATGEALVDGEDVDAEQRDTFTG